MSKRVSVKNSAETHAAIKAGHEPGALARIMARPSGYNTENRTDYVQSDGSVQAMASVLAQRAELAKLKGPKRLEAAFRFRAGLQGVLASFRIITSAALPLAFSSRCSCHMRVRRELLQAHRAHAGTTLRRR